MTQPNLNDLFSVPLETFLADPYPFYHRLRSEAPVYWDERNRTWILTRHADVAAVLRDPRFLAVAPLGGSDPRFHVFRDVTRRWLIHLNPPEHTRLRALVNKAFLPRVVEQLRPHIEQTVKVLIDKVQAAGRIDLIADLAHPLPVVVITRMLGVSAKDDVNFQQWTDALSRGLEPADMLTEPILERANQAAQAFDDFFRGLIGSKRQQPSDDLLSGLIAVEDQGQCLSTDEIIALGMLLFIAGHETTVNLIGNGILALLRHPGQMALLRGAPDRLMKSAVEEFLRYDSSVQMTFRRTAADVELGGQTLRAGSDVQLVLGAANRDPEAFPNPDQLDVTRADNKHLAFGGGIHYCVGAPLARVEAQVAIRAMLTRLPGLRLASDTVDWRPIVGLRGLKALPLVF